MYDTVRGALYVCASAPPPSVRHDSIAEPCVLRALRVGEGETWERERRKQHISIRSVRPCYGCRTRQTYYCKASRPVKPGRTGVKPIIKIMPIINQKLELYFIGFTRPIISL